MKLGTENKKALYAAVLLGAGALYGIYSSFFSGPPTTSASTTPLPATAGTAPIANTSDSGSARAILSQRNDEFKPVLHPKRPEDRIDPTRVDPTLRLDLLAKLQEVPAAEGLHNLFQIGPAPPKVEMPKGTEPIVTAHKGYDHPGPLPPPPQPPIPPIKRAVPAGVKYYGWVAPSGSDRKKAFFLDDSGDVFVRTEGETLKGHYRVVHIGPTNVVLEDTNDKLQQTLTKVEDAA
jgi:hypothetical protein